MNKASTETTKRFMDGLDTILKPKAKAPKLAQKIALDKIVPDPDQPRRDFDKAELDELTDSIRVNGVLTPIAVQPAAENGTHMLVYGERRFRAAKLAGLTEIVSTVIDPATTNIRTVQLIENMQRSDLTAEEIAASVDALIQEGHKGSEIAKLLGLPPARVTEYRAILTMPPKLRALASTVGAQTLYQLFKLWEKEGPNVERLIDGQGASGITRAQVEALAARLKSGAAEPRTETPPPAPITAGERAQEPQETPEETEAPVPNPQTRPVQQPTGGAGTGPGSETPAPAPTAAPHTSSAALVWIVKHGEDLGRLVTDQLGPDSRTAMVAFNQGQDVRPVPLSELTLFEIVGG